jgi:cytochrome c oxidase subunit II
MEHLTGKTRLVLYIIFFCPFLLGGCGNMPASLDPKGGAAMEIANLGWVMIILGSVIWGVVTMLLLVGLFRRRVSIEPYQALPKDQNQRAVNVWIVSGGIILPAVILFILIALIVGTLRSMPVERTSASLVVEVTGHQWWWEVKYPGHEITLRDALRIPAGEPVKISLTSADVIHSFWVPELHGKFDLVPGHHYEFILQADQPGEYDGRCAEFCGLSHTHMTFLVIAMESAEFTAWLAGGEN